MHVTLTITVSLTLVHDPQPPDLPTGIRHIADVMPEVLAAHGLELPPSPDTQPHAAGDNHLVDAMLDALKGALAGLVPGVSAVLEDGNLPGPSQR